MGTGTLGRVYRDLGLGDARRGTRGREVQDAGTQNTGRGDAKYGTRGREIRDAGMRTRIVSVPAKVGGNYFLPHPTFPCCSL